MASRFSAEASSSRPGRTKQPGATSVARVAGAAAAARTPPSPIRTPRREAAAPGPWVSDRRAGVGVDLEAEADLGDAGGLPGHPSSPSGLGRNTRVRARPRIDQASFAHVRVGAASTRTAQYL